MIDKEDHQKLIELAIKTLEDILTSDETSTHDKITAACQILSMSEGFKRSQSNGSSTLPSTISDNTSPILSNSQEKSASSQESYFLPANYIQIDNFLSPEEYNLVLNTTLSSEIQFKASTTTTKENDYRKSKVLHSRDFPQVADFMRLKVANIFSHILKHLNYPPFEIDSIEAQLTAHNDGDFYKKHVDASSEKTKTRIFTYVYYFYQEPKVFSGGELKLYDTDISRNRYVNRDTYHLIEPQNNSIIFFNSRSKHEVLPIQCSSQDFKDSRFTINGWIRKK